MGRRRAKGNTEKPKEKKAGPGNPGIFLGGRREFLMDFVDPVVDRYLDRWPYHLYDGPRDIPANATPEERAALEEKQKEEAREQALPQVHSFLKNQVTKLNAVKKSPFRDFFKQLLKQLSATKTRHEAEHKIWMRQPEYRQVLMPEFKRRWAASDEPPTQELAFHVKVASEMYERQPEEVKARVRQLVQEDYEQQIARNKAVEQGDVTPESAQLCRENLSIFAEPLIRELLRLCNLTVGTLLLARPPSEEGEPILVMAVNVGETIKDEGGLKLEDFEPENYTSVFLMHFMCFVVLTEAKSAALHRAEEKRQKLAAEGARGVGMSALEGMAYELDSVQGSTTAGDNDKAAAPPRKGGRPSRRGARMNIDAQELSDTETSESSTSDSDSNDSDSEDGESEAEGAGSRLFAARAAREARQRRLRQNRDAANIPVDEYGVPLHDVRGRVFSPNLRERLSRMFVDKRSALLLEIDTMSDYELRRQEGISKIECQLRAELLHDGILKRTDPLYGDVTPKRINSAPSTDGSEEEPPLSSGAEAREGSAPGMDVDEEGAAQRTFAPSIDNEAGSARRDDGATCENDKERRTNVGPEIHAERADDTSQPTPAPSSARAQDVQRADAREGERVRETQGGGLQGDERTQGEQQDTSQDDPRAARKGRGEGRKGSGVKPPKGTSAAARKRGAQGSNCGRGASNKEVADVFSASRVGWPDWFSLGVDNLVLDAASGSEADASWRKLVSTYAELEKCENWAKDRKAPPNGHRPKEIGEWIKRARATTFMPKPAKDQPPSDFVDDWRASMWAWWSSLNPEWRERTVHGVVAGMRGEGDWSALHYAGPNGLLSVLKGMKWWFDLEEKPEGTRQWLEIVYDVQWALDGLLSQLSGLSQGEHRPTKRRKTK